MKVKSSLFTLGEERSEQQAAPRPRGPTSGPGQS